MENMGDINQTKKQVLFFCLFRIELRCSKHSSLFQNYFVNCSFDFAANYQLIEQENFLKILFHFTFLVFQGNNAIVNA